MVEQEGEYLFLGIKIFSNCQSNFSPFIWGNLGPNTVVGSLSVRTVRNSYENLFFPVEIHLLGCSF